MRQHHRKEGGGEESCKSHAKTKEHSSGGIGANSVTVTIKKPETAGIRGYRTRAFPVIDTGSMQILRFSKAGNAVYHNRKPAACRRITPDKQPKTSP